MSRTRPGQFPDAFQSFPQNVPVLTILGHLQIGRVQLRPPEDTKIWGGTRAGEEESRRRGIGGQGLGIQKILGPAGTGLQVKERRGGEGFEEMAEEDGNYKGAPTGVVRDASDAKDGERGAIRRVKRRKKQDR